MRYSALRPHLDERQRRLVLGVEARQLGRGGIKAIASATGVHPDTVARGVREITGEPEPSPRVRAPGGGRKRLAETDPGLTGRCGRWWIPRLAQIRCRRCCGRRKSTRRLAAALGAVGHPVSDRTVARLLAEMGFSLQGNAKVVEGNQHADRDAQFAYLNGQAREHLAAGHPVVSVDTKKKLRHEVARGE